MEMQYVNSSDMKAVGYDQDNVTLTIEFKGNNSIYEYFDVPQYIYDELMSSASKGKYAHANIYGKYRQQKIR